MTKTTKHYVNGLDSTVMYGVGGNKLKAVTAGFEMKNNADDAYVDLKGKDGHFTGNLQVDGNFASAGESIVDDKLVQVASTAAPTTTTGDGSGIMSVTGLALAGGSATDTGTTDVKIALTNGQAATARVVGATHSTGGAVTVRVGLGVTGSGIASILNNDSTFTGAGMASSWAADILHITCSAGTVSAASCSKFTGQTFEFSNTDTAFNSSISLNVATGKGFEINGTEILSASTALTVPYGGTGLSTLVAHKLYVGNGTSAMSAIDVGGDNKYLGGNAAADPSFKYITDLRDDGGDLTVETAEVASQVNHIKVTPAVTGSGVEIAAVSGTDANIDVDIDGKGSGELILQSTATGDIVAGSDIDIAAKTIKTTTTNGDISLVPNGTGKVSVPAGYETANLGDDDLVNKQYVDETVAAGINGDNREATVTADSSNHTFSVGAALPSPSGKIRLTQTVVKVGTGFSGGSVAGLRVTDGTNVLVAFGIIGISNTTDDQEGGACLTDIKGDTIKVEFRTANDAGTAIPTAGTLEIFAGTSQT